MTDELETFIQEQKSRLTRDRQDLGRDPQLPYNGYQNSPKPPQSESNRRKWDPPKPEPADPHRNGVTMFKENIPPKPLTPEQGIVTKLGTYDRTRQKLQEERRQEYNRLLAEQSVRGRGRSDPALLPAAGKSIHMSPAVHFAPSPEIGLVSKLGAYDKTRQTLQDERHQDYNRQFADHQYPMVSDMLRHPQEDSYEATLPGVQNNPAAQLRKIEERNREYNEFLQQQKGLERSNSRSRLQPNGGHVEDRDPEQEEYRQWMNDRPVPRKGWGTPTPSYEEILDKKRREERNYRRFEDPIGMQLGDIDYTRTSISDGYLNRKSDLDERKMRELDREYESKRVRFADDQRRRRVFQDDPSWPFSEPPRRARTRNMELEDLDTDYPSGNVYAAPRPMPTSEPVGGRGVQTPQRDNGGAFIIGKEVRASEEQRKKAAYRQELEQQMAESAANKNREKFESRRPSIGNEADVGRGRPPLPRPILAPSRLPDSMGSMMAPVGNYGNGSAFNSPLEEAYYYYGLQNPLDAAAQPPPMAAAAPQFISTRQMAAPPWQPHAYEAPTVHNSPGVAIMSDKEFEAAKRANDDKKRLYQLELQRQMEEDKMKKQREKEDKEKYDRKLEAEIKAYDPFGRGGGGAPMRDRFGNIITSRNTGGSQPDLSTLGQAPSQASMVDVGREPEVEEPWDPNRGKSKWEKAGLSGTDRGEADTSFARGGNGIFGEPMTQEQKTNRLRYQDELRKQMEEKDRKKQEEKERQQREDELLQKKIEEDIRRAKEAEVEEKRKAREKEEQAERQAQELKRQQEEQRLADERKKKEAQEARNEEYRRQDEIRRQDEMQKQDEQKHRPPETDRRLPTQAAQQQPRYESSRLGYSPPSSPQNSRRTQPPGSPPVPASRTQSRQSRVKSAEVLSQLAEMKKQLQSERKRVESDLKHEQTEPEVFDPRIHVRPDYHNQRPYHVDVFEVARNREPVSVRRPAHPSNVRTFRHLRHEPTESREDLRRMFTATPNSDNGLEAQQAALIMKQEEDLAKLKKPHRQNRGRSDFDEPEETPRYTPGNVLNSDSAFIGLNSGDHHNYPDDLDDLPGHRNIESRSRHRRQVETPEYKPRPPSGVSLASLNPEDVRLKNEARLRKLHAMAGDDISTGDPEDILNNFTKTQKHRRPPSSQTLMDDSWLRPGTSN